MSSRTYLYRSILSVLVLLGLLAAVRFYILNPSGNMPSEMKAEQSSESQPEVIRLDHVVKVFMHYPGAFSVLYEDPKTKELQTTGDITEYAKKLYGTDCWRFNRGTGGGGKISVTVFNDTASDKMHLIVKKFNPYWCEVELHMSIRSLSGADYNYQDGEITRTATTRAVE